MNYQKIYNSIIESAKFRMIEGYFEKHHILPKCLGGTNNKENIVKLTAREHYIVHRLLTRIYPTNKSLAYAFWCMCNGQRKNRYTPSSRTYEEARLMFSNIKKGSTSPMKGKFHSQETRTKISNSKKGQASWSGRRHSESTRLKQSNSAKSRKTTEEGENKRRQGISENNKKPKSLKHTENIRKSKLGNRNPMFGKKYRIVDGKRIFYTL